MSLMSVPVVVWLFTLWSSQCGLFECGVAKINRTCFELAVSSLRSPGAFAFAGGLSKGHGARSQGSSRSTAGGT